MKWESDTSLCKNSAFAANSNLNIKKMRYTVLLYSITHLKVKGHTSYKKYHVFCEVTISIPLLLSVIHKNIFYSARSADSAAGASVSASGEALGASSPSASESCASIAAALISSKPLLSNFVFINSPIGLTYII